MREGRLDGGGGRAGRARGGGGRRRTGNVFKFMAAFKTPSASGHGLQRATAREGRGGCKEEGGHRGETRGREAEERGREILPDAF